MYVGKYTIGPWMVFLLEGIDGFGMDESSGKIRDVSCWKCHWHFKAFWFVIIYVESAHAIYGSDRFFLWSSFQWEMLSVDISIHDHENPQKWSAKCLHQICIQRFSEQWSMFSYVGQYIKGWKHTLKENVSIEA